MDQLRQRADEEATAAKSDKAAGKVDKVKNDKAPGKRDKAKNDKAWGNSDKAENDKAGSNSDKVKTDKAGGNSDKAKADTTAGKVDKASAARVAGEDPKSKTKEMDANAEKPLKLPKAATSTPGEERKSGGIKLQEKTGSDRTPSKIAENNDQRAKELPHPTKINPKSKKDEMKHQRPHHVAPSDAYMGGMEGHKMRSFLHTLLLQLGIRIKYFLTSIFFLKPIFMQTLSDYPSMLRPEGMPEPGYVQRFLLRALWMVGSIGRGFPALLFIAIKLRVMHVLNLIHSMIMQTIIFKMERSGFDFSKAREVPLPEYDWKNGNPDEFYKTFVERPHPVVLRGFLNNTEIMNYTFDHMMEQFGEETVLLTDPDKEDGYKGKLKDVMNPGVYLHNSEVIFNRYPGLKKLLETNKLEPYMKRKSAFAQFFIGRGGTGAPLHHAYVWNFFHMIDGRKKWYFIDPYDFYLAYPMFKLGTTAGAFFGLYPDKYDEKVLSAFKYCPYYVTELQPGDVLLNPAWWGHGIKNLTGKSVGIATRWMTDGIIGRNFNTMEEDMNINRFASFNSMMGPNSIRYLHKTLENPVPQHDEHITLRDFETTRFLDKQKKMAEGKLVFDGWRPIF